MSAPHLTSIRCAPEFLLDSPTNPRTYYGQAALAELADSIRSQGVIQPILARPLPGQLRHEIVVGHRRTRAARLAGLETIPAIVRHMSDEEATTFQIHENLQREDVTPLEEAEGFSRLVREFKQPIEQVIKDSGKSKGYVYGRLSLLKLSVAARQAMADGLQTETALVIAKHANERIQQLAVAKVRRHNGEWMPTAEAKRVLNDEFTIRLEKAPFSLDDAALNKAAGVCSTCPNRAGNAPELADLPADTCVDRDCYDLKCEEHWQHVIMQLQDDGHTVLQDGDAIAAFSFSGQTPLKATFHFGPGKSYTAAQMLDALPEGHEPPRLTYIAHDGEEPRGYIATAELNAVMVALQLKQPAATAATPAPAAPPTPAAARPTPDDDDEEQHTTQASAAPASAHAETPEEHAAGTCWKARILPAIMRAAAARERNTDDLRVIAANAIDFAHEVGISIAAELLGRPDQADANPEDWLRCKLPDLSADQLGLLTTLLGIALDAPGCGREQIRGRIELARLYGVNVLDHIDQPAAHAEADAGQDDDEDTPAPAAQRSPSRTPARYRNPATGETWSGRGLQPKWLKTAIAAGNKLSDYAVEVAA